MTLLFCDTLIEDEDLYRFLRQTSAYLGVPVTTIADGLTPWQVFHDKRFLGNSQKDPFSRILKRELARSWVDANFPVPGWVNIYVGIDWMEAHRMKNVHVLWSPYRIHAPLIEDKTFDKERFTAEMVGWGIDVPRLYKMGFPHNNCGGFCVKAGKAHFLNLLDKMPERYRYHEEQEAILAEHITPEGKKPYTILREEVKKVKRYISLRELRERQEEIRATEDGQFDWGGCGCFSDIPDEELVR